MTWYQVNHPDGIARILQEHNFGGGPHQCIGKGLAQLEAQLILATVTRRFRLRHVAGQIVEPQALVTLQPRGGLPMIVERA